MVIRLYYGNSFPITQKGAQVLNPFVPTLLRPMLSAAAIKNPSRVPRYQNLKFFVGFCEKFFKPLTMWGEVW